MRTHHELALREQFHRYLSSLVARIRFSNGGGSNLEVAVQPSSNSGGRGGVFLYVIDNGRDVHPSEEREARREQYVYLTPKNARRLGHALLFMAGEVEVDECKDEKLTPSRG